MHWEDRDMKHPILWLVVFWCCHVLLAADGSVAETPGERFRKAIKEIEAACAKRRLDPNEVCGGVAKLKPADPLATEEGRFAHSIKIPNPVPEDSGYKPGMTPEEYFSHLCKTEAGEFIYKTVENVEGLYMMRPRQEATDEELSHLYALEDPYGYVTEGSSKNARELLVRHGAYSFLENKVLAGSSAYQRYVARYVDNSKTLASEASEVAKSQYGYIWRGIRRHHDREFGIAGGELIVLDTQSQEILAVRRGFLLSGDVRNNPTGIWWLGAHACPKGKKGRTYFYTFDFIRTVLMPGHFPAEEDGAPNATK